MAITVTASKAPAIRQVESIESGSLFPLFLLPSLSLLRSIVRSLAIVTILATATFHTISTRAEQTIDWDCKNIAISGPAKWSCRAGSSTTIITTTRSSITTTARSSTDRVNISAPTVAVDLGAHSNVQAVEHQNLAQQDWRANGSIQSSVAVLESPYCGGQYVNPLNPDGSKNSSNDAGQPIEASAGSSLANDGIATFTDNVLITQGNTSLRADNVSYDTNSTQVELNGNVVIRTTEAAFGGSSASINMDGRTSVVREANYVVHQQHLRGTAKSITTNAQEQITVKNGTYTRCEPSSNLWQLQANELKIDHQSGQGSAKHAVVRVKGVPVAYVPYARFPVGDARQSGVLFPSLSDTNAGFDITLPYYFNIAPNADATLAPRYSADRGYITEAELRWLNPFDKWTISSAYIDNDTLYGDELAQSGKGDSTQRWVVDIKERGKIGRNILSSIDYTRVSDNDYLRDLNTTSLSVSRTTHLSQKASLQYINDLWQAGIKIQQYQTIDDNASNESRPFETTPELWLAYQSPGAPFRVGGNASIRHTAFKHDELTDGNRSFGELNINFPMRWGGIHLTPSIGVQHLQYSLDSSSKSNEIDSSPSFTAPQGFIDAKMVFEKRQAFSQQLADGSTDHKSPYRHRSYRTLEPGIFYLYRDAAAQDKLPLFDTGQLTSNRYQLTRQSSFSGYDRLEDSNQVSVYITHRIFNSQGAERLTATLGQIFYFQDQRQQSIPNSSVQSTTLLQRPIGQKTSALIGDAQVRLGQNWQSLGTILWGSNQNQIEEGSFAIRFRDQKARGSIANLGYHYRQRVSNNSVLQKSIEQTDISLITPLARHWSLIGRYQYDLSLDRSSEALAGLEYNNCCIKLRMVYRDGLVYNGSDSSGADNERDRSVFLQIELKGLFGIGDTIENILDESIFGYRSLSSRSGQTNGTNGVAGASYTSF